MVVLQIPRNKTNSTFHTRDPGSADPGGPPDIYTTTSPFQTHSLLSTSPKIWIQWGKKKKKSDLKANTQVNVIKYQKVKSIEVLCLGINVL